MSAAPRDSSRTAHAERQNNLTRDVMRINKLSNTEIFGMDWAATDRHTALRSMHRARLPPVTGTSSGWGTDVAARDKRSVRASLKGKGDLRAAWWNVYSRVYLAVVPNADLERAMYSFHRMHHTLTLGWLSYLMSVHQTTVDIKKRGVLSAVRTAASGNGSHV
jgi:hypothetical protein